MDKTILKLAFPNIISNITIPIVGMVDIAILGHLESEKYLGAVALGGMMFNFIYFGFGFLRMSTSGFTAQAYGEGNNKEIILSLSRALLTAFIGSIIIIALQIPIAYVGFSLIEGSAEVENLAREYFFIRIYAAPASIGIYALSGWFLGLQNSKYPMIMAISVIVVNLILNLTFVYGFGMKSEGVAYGTLIAQYIGLTIGICLYLFKYKRYQQYWDLKSMLNLSALKRYVLVNRDILIRTLMLLLTLSFFTAESAKFGDTILAANTILLQFFFIYSYFIDGFAHAAEALVGKFTGARDLKKLKLSIKRLFVWGTAISLAFTLLYYLGGSKMLYILTSNKDVIEATIPYIYWIVSIPILTFAAFIWDGIYIGATASVSMRNAMLISTLLIFFPVYYLIGRHLGNHGLWMSLMIFMASRGIILTIYSKVIFRINNI